MAKFKCTLCNSELELDQYTIQVIEDKIASPEAMCCNNYMKPIRSNEGFGSIILKPGGKVGGKF